MPSATGSLPSTSMILLGLIGLFLTVFSLLSLLARKRPASREGSQERELENLFSEIGRGLRALSSPARAGGLFYREKQEQVGHLLAELQRRLRLLDDGRRQPWEAKAGLMLAQAAQAGITLPPLEAPLISGQFQR